MGANHAKGSYYYSWQLNLIYEIDLHWSTLKSPIIYTSTSQNIFYRYFRYSTVNHFYRFYFIITVNINVNSFNSCSGEKDSGLGAILSLLLMNKETPPLLVMFFVYKLRPFMLNKFCSSFVSFVSRILAQEFQNDPLHWFEG